MNKYQVMDVRSITCFAEDSSHLAQLGCGGRQAFPVALALDDDLLAGVGQAVWGAAPQDRVVVEAEPFLRGPVAGDDEAGGPVIVDDQLVEVGGLLGGEAVETQVLQYEQVGSEEGAEGLVGGVVGPGLFHGLEEVAGADEADGVPGSDGGVAQGLGQEALADAGGTRQQDVFAPVQGFPGEGGVQQASVQGDVGGPAEVLQAADFLGDGPVQAGLDAAVVAAVDLVGEDDFQEESVAQLLPAG